MLIAISVITRIPDNFITGRSGRVSNNGILTEGFQIIFDGIIIVILVLEKRTFSKKEGDVS